MPSSPKYVASAILAVYNSEKTIEACLDSLLEQSVKIEIIVVDDGSTDGTMSILQGYHTTKRDNIHIYSQKHRGPAIARNLGVRSARSPIVLFVDSDMTFDQRYVEQLIDPILSGREIGTYTVGERVSNWDNVWARCWNWQEGWADGRRFPADPPQYGTDYRAILRAEFDSVGGFDDIGYTDTWTLFHKLNRRPRATNAVCYHKNPDSLSAVYRQAKWAAKRPYKMGRVGDIYALMRTSLPVSLVKGLVVAVMHSTPAFFVFKVVYDWGRFVGIIEMIGTGKKAK